ncbi:MAG: hypothetical protein J6W46_08165 [Spirochaetaceae bacterium]|nr:hypothetical protein [Spirochaetaceae bacterium]
MQMFIIFVLLSVAVCLLMLVFSGKLSIFGGGSKKRKKRSKQGAPSKKYSDGVEPGCCPLCGTFLVGKEKIKSSVFEGGNASDRLCYIHGCPHCLPPETPEIKRICPVCRKTVPLDGHLTARMIERKGGAHHVHILGCTECHKK